MDRDKKLAQILVEFADTLGAEFSIQAILDHLVQRIVDMLPVTGAGVMLMTENDLHFVAASNKVVRRIEALQNELQEGPCLEAYGRRGRRGRGPQRGHAVPAFLAAGARRGAGGGLHVPDADGRPPPRCPGPLSRYVRRS